MKECPFCHELIEESETLCPFCGTVQEVAVPVSNDHPTTIEQSTLFDEEPPLQQDVITRPSTEKNRTNQENRLKNTTPPYQGLWHRFTRFFRFFFEKLVHPTNHFSRKRQTSRAYGYIFVILSTLLAAYTTTHAIEALLSQYQVLADISILPSLTATPNYIFVFLKLIVFYAFFYLGFPAIAFGVKHIFLKRQHVFHYWLTQFAGMNALSFLLLLVTAFLTIVSPIALSVVILFFFGLHLLSIIVAFVIAISQEANESKIDTPYLAMIGLTVQLILTMSLLLILF